MDVYALGKGDAMSVSAAEQGEWDVERELALHHGRWIQDEVDKPIRHAQIAIGVVFLLQTVLMAFLGDLVGVEVSARIWMNHLLYFAIVGLLGFMLLKRSRATAVLLVSFIAGVRILLVLYAEAGQGSVLELLMLGMCARAAFGCFKYQSLKRGLMLTTD